MTGAQFKENIDYVPVNIDKSIEFLHVLTKEMELRNSATSGKSVSQIRENIGSRSEAEK